MPALQPVPLTVKMAVSGILSGVPIACIYHERYTGGPPSAAECALFATDVFTQWTTTFGFVLNSDLVITLATVTDLNSNTGASGTHSGVATGSVFSAPAPNQCAAVVNWHAGTRYRGGHPKTFLPGLSNIDFANPVSLTATAQAAFASAAANFRTNLATITHGGTVFQGLAVVHYKKAHAVLTPPQTEFIVSESCRQMVGSQRGRRS